MKIIVVGAGVVGLACAYELVRDGHEVVVLDGGAAGQAASHGNAAKIAIAEAGPVPAPGMVVQAVKWMLKNDSPLYVKPSLSPPFVRFMLRMARNCTEARFRAGLEINLELSRQAVDIFDEWQDAGLTFEMHQRGVLLAYENVDAFRDRLRYQDTFSAYGVHAQVLDAAGVQAVEPALSDVVRHGLFYPEDRQIEPDSLTTALVGHITTHGGTVLENSAVTGFDQGSGGVTAVRTATGARHTCDGVVLAAGVWSTGLAARLGVALPVVPGKGYSVDYSPAPITLRTSLTLEDAHVAVTPLDGMLRVAGTMEFSGLGEGINDVRVAAVKRAAAHNFRDWDPATPHRPAWAGLRPMTPDGLPIVGPLADGANVWTAGGHAMLGLTQAPSTGRLIRQLVRGDVRSDPRIGLDRFGSRRVRIG
jgi:D-amino-acid dehydrogenase